MTRYVALIGLLGSVWLAGCGKTDTQGMSAADASDVLPATVSYQDFGDYRVHFNATPTRELTPEIASEYGIVRSDYQALLNISIRHKAENGSDVAASATVKASATNLTGQLKNISVHKLAEGDAIYYLGEVPITNTETLIFSIEVTPEGSSDTFKFKFKKQFFVG